MVETGRKLSEMKSCLAKYPQAQRNLRVTEKPPLEELPEVLALVQQAQRELGDLGRVLLRYSGTEPKVRLLIEGRDGAVINRQADGIAALLQEAIGES